MVRSLIASLSLVSLTLTLTLTGCFLGPKETRVTQPEPKEEILHVSTAYAFEPEKVESGPFDKRAARDALAKVDVTRCGAPPNGHAKVTFAPDGTVSKVDVDHPHDLPPAARDCVRTEFAKARVLAFDGQPITLGTSWRASR